jgi:hypothetical protein
MHVTCRDLGRFLGMGHAYCMHGLVPVKGRSEVLDKRRASASKCNTYLGVLSMRECFDYLVTVYISDKHGCDVAER